MNYKKVTLLTIILICLGLTGLRAQTVTDIDSNVYNTVTIGTQVWMAENLKTSKYRNGDSISTGLSDDDWMSTTYGACSIYDNDDANNTTYGKLYNWYAVTDSRLLCPDGWHVPADAEWTTLISSLGGENVAGSKLKEAGTMHWNSPNNANNESGFTALPAGQNMWYGPFGGLGNYGYWWSTSEGFGSGSWGRTMVHSEDTVRRFNYTKVVGFSVRCVNDNVTSISDFLNIDESILYPNPATERLCLKNSNYANATIMIFNLQGKQILLKQMDSKSIDISNLRQGIYIAKIVYPENTVSTKFIKE